MSAISDKMKLLVALIALQFCFAGFHIVSRLALNIGVSKVVYPVYRNIIALLLLGPSAYFIERKERPPLNLWLLAQFFLLALVGITANQGFYLLGLYYASPTFASAMQNSVPAITFLLAAGLRIEKISILKRDGIAKVVGTVASVGGATIITLYKGSPLPFLQQTSQVDVNTVGAASPFSDSYGVKMHTMVSWTWGCIFLLGHCFSWGGWIVMQASVLRKYPAKLSLTSFICFFGLIQFLVIAACAETDLERWKIHTGEELFTILYAGIVSSAIVISLQTWCIHKGGPVCVAVFQPLQTLLVAVMAALILGDHLYSGGIVGAVLIIFGLYSVIWGKSEEQKLVTRDKDEQLTKHLLDDNRETDKHVKSEIP